MLMKVLFQIVVFTIFNCTLLFCNDYMRIGVIGGVNFNQHYTDFRALPGVPNCCPKFGNGSGQSFFIGLSYDHAIFNTFYLGTNLVYSNLNGQLKALEPTTIYYNGGMNVGEFQHIIDAELSMLSFEPKISLKLFDRLFIISGISLSIPIQKDYSQEERITKPSGMATFVDENGNNTNSMTRNLNSGEIEGVQSVLLHANVAVMYDFPLNKKNTLLISPLIGYRYGLNNFLDGYSWKINTLYAGLSIVYSPEPWKPPVYEYKKIYRNDTVVLTDNFVLENTFKKGKEFIDSNETQVENTIYVEEIISSTDTVFTPRDFALSASIRVFTVDSSIAVKPVDRIKIEEFQFTQMHPLLNYVFFDENSSDIPYRYNMIKNSNYFDIKNISKFETISVYYDLLNIVGYRLKMNPNTSISLVGCNSGVGIEKGNTELSRSRAETIKRYFTSVWGIDGSRIRIIARGLPEKPSTPVDQTEKIAENRRVEIIPDSPQILEPITITDIKNIFNPEVIRFQADVQSEIGVEYCYININFNNNALRPIEIDRDVKQYFDINLIDMKNQIDFATGAMKYQLSVQDKRKKKVITDEKSVPLEVTSIKQKQSEKLADKEIEKYNLILFDFNSGEITDRNLSIVNYIKSRININSKVEITGFTDITGSDEQNQFLSSVRAETTYRNIKFWEAKFKGVGSNVKLFDNSIPEGRFYSRTVEIIIENPIEY